MSHIRNKSHKNDDATAFNLGLNIIVPAIILSFLSREHRLGPMWGLIIAVSIPLSYGIYHYVKRKSHNVLSLLGIISVSITGGIGLFRLSTGLFAFKEALVPLTIGSIFLYLTLFNFEKMKPLIFNRKVFNTKLIESRLEDTKSQAKLNSLIKDILLLVCIAFFVGALLNFIIARTIVVSDPGSVEFNEELGRFSITIMFFVSLPLFLFLMLIIYFFVRKMMALTSLTFDQVFGLDDDRKRE
ncbi:MAG: VC0807 family protein [Candidatus Woesearchaeota archaeon]